MRNRIQIEIDAPPERVFYWLEDGERVMQWAKGVVENEDLEVTDAKVGSTFRQVYEENGRRMEFQGRCTAFEQDRRLAVQMTSRMFDLEVDYRLEDLGGRTRLTQESESRFHGVMRLVGTVMCWLMKGKAEDCIAEDFGRLKALAESMPDEAA